MTNKYWKHKEDDNPNRGKRDEYTDPTGRKTLKIQKSANQILKIVSGAEIKDDAQACALAPGNEIN